MVLTKNNNLKFKNIFNNSKKAISTIIILILLLFISILVFIQVNDYFELTLTELEISSNFDNFETNIEILYVDGNSLKIKNTFKENLLIESVIIGETTCSILINTINIGISTLNIGNCVENLSLDSIYPVLIKTKFGLKVENEIINSLNLQTLSQSIFGQSLITPTPLNLVSYVGDSIYVNVSKSTSNDISTWINFDNSLVGYWNFETENLTHTFDLSGNNHAQKKDGILTSSINPVRGTYINFDGINDNLIIPDSNFIDGATELTISIWIKNSENTIDNAIIAKDSWTGSASFLLWRDDSGSTYGRTDMIAILISSSSNSVRLESASNSMVDFNWHHVVVTFKAADSSGLRLYIDGVEDVNSPVSTTSLTSIKTNGNDLYIGSKLGSGTEFKGSMDEFMIFNRSLSANEINSLYDSKINQFQNNFTDLAPGNHTFQTCTIDIDGNYGCLEKRTISLIGTPYTTPSSLDFFRVNSNNQNDFDTDAVDKAINNNGQSCLWKVHFTDTNSGTLNYDIIENSVILMSIDTTNDCSGGVCIKTIDKCSSSYDALLKTAYIVESGTTNTGGAPSDAFTNSCTSSGSGNDGWDNDCDRTFDESSSSCNVCSYYQKSYSTYTYYSSEGGVCTGNTLSAAAPVAQTLKYNDLTSCQNGNTGCSAISYITCDSVSGSDGDYVCDSTKNFGSCSSIDPVSDCSYCGSTTTYY